MARWHPSYCRHCGATVEETGRISARGRCPACGNARLIANHEQLLDHGGPFFDHWRRRCLAAFGVALVDEPEAGG